MRMFVAVLPTAPAVEELATFLEPRREASAADPASPLRWSDPEQWHLTLAFLPSVADRHLDDLTDRLAEAARRRRPFSCALSGAGAFPDPARAKVLYARMETSSADEPELGRLATGARAAAAAAGAAPEGGPFRPHVTLARSGRPLEASRWLRVLDTHRGTPFVVEEMVLVASHLGEGPRRRPRHEVVGRFLLQGG